jgi:hypothetical protein
VHLCVDMQGLTERDLANSVDGNRASTRRCDHKAISRTNNIYEIYPAAATRGYAWNVAPLLRKMAAGDSTALGAIDHGYRVIIAEDAVCSSSD